MNSGQSIRSIIKITLLAGICLYTVLASLLLIYLQLYFLDLSYFSKTIIVILAINTVFLVNLFLSAKLLLLPEQNPRRLHSDRIACFILSVLGLIIFLILAERNGEYHDRFFACCNWILVALSALELRSPKN